MRSALHTPLGVSAHKTNEERGRVFENLIRKYALR